MSFISDNKDEIKDEFSVETAMKFGSYGYHDLEQWHTPNEVELIKNQYK